MNLFPATKRPLMVTVKIAKTGQASFRKIMPFNNQEM